MPQKNPDAKPEIPSENRPGKIPEKSLGRSPNKFVGAGIRATVIIPVFNGENFLAAALRSILRQTMADFELLVIDGGSSDRSVEIARSFDDPRIMVIAHPPRFSLVESLNEGLELARGKYVVRMDADDLSLPDRLARQIEFMEACPNVAVGASYAIEFGQRRQRLYSFAAEPNELRTFAFFECPVAHPTVILRREFFSKHGLFYNRDYGVCEDWELWLRVLQFGEIAVQREPLLLYRHHTGSVSKKHLDRLHEQSLIIDQSSLRPLNLQGHRLSRYHRVLALAHQHRTLQKPFLVSDLVQWVLLLLRANDERKVYDPTLLRRQILTRLLKMAAREPSLWGPLFFLWWRVGWGPSDVVSVVGSILRRLRPISEISLASFEAS